MSLRGATRHARSTREETRSKIYRFSRLYSAKSCLTIAAASKGLLPDAARPQQVLPSQGACIDGHGMTNH
jgi:hypothetical protein